MAEGFLSFLKAKKQAACYKVICILTKLSAVQRMLQLTVCLFCLTVSKCLSEPSPPRVQCMSPFTAAGCGMVKVISLSCRQFCPGSGRSQKRHHSLFSVITRVDNIGRGCFYIYECQQAQEVIRYLNSRHYRVSTWEFFSNVTKIEVKCFYLSILKESAW